MWWKYKAVISEHEAPRNKFNGHKKGRFPETDDAVFMLLKRITRLQ
jgi:hypothetical protein